MRKDNRLPRVLHVLIHLDRHDKLMTSGKIAKMLDTNPVVVRRIMSGLRNKGYVSSSKGAGGGWQLQSQLNEISLYDVHMALGEPELLSLGKWRQSKLPSRTIRRHCAKDDHDGY